MDAYRIEGGYPLKGTVSISGSKNSSLPCMFAALLTREPVTIKRIPKLRDTATTIKLLEYLGKQCVWENGALTITEHALDGADQRNKVAPYELIRQMRASVLACGPLLARWGKAKVALPGGCSLGLRPIDIHLDGFKAMGAKISVTQGFVNLEAFSGKLRNLKYKLRFPSVGATENFMLAAALIAGKTVLENVAREPEIVDLANMLSSMGASVKGAGSARLVIIGQPMLKGVTHQVIPDRLEAGSFLIFAACVEGSEIKILDCQSEHLSHFLTAIKNSGLKPKIGPDWVAMKTPKGFRPRPVSIETVPYPGFVTDLQPLWMAYMARAKGTAKIQETIFENRFVAAAELNRMGARIVAKGDQATVTGVTGLHSAPIMESDIRAGAALIAAALAAQGTTVLSRIYHTDRGHENLETKLRNLGARIERFEEVKYTLQPPAAKAHV